MCFVLGLVTAADAQESAGDALQRRQSALHAAAAANHAGLCTELVAAGAKVEAASLGRRHSPLR